MWRFHARAHFLSTFARAWELSAEDRAALQSGVFSIRGTPSPSNAASRPGAASSTTTMAPPITTAPAVPSTSTSTPAPAPASTTEQSTSTTTTRAATSTTPSSTDVTTAPPGRVWSSWPSAQHNDGAKAAPMRSGGEGSDPLRELENNLDALEFVSSITSAPNNPMPPSPNVALHVDGFSSTSSEIPPPAESAEHPSAHSPRRSPDPASQMSEDELAQLLADGEISLFKPLSSATSTASRGGAAHERPSILGEYENLHSAAPGRGRKRPSARVDEGKHKLKQVKHKSAFITRGVKCELFVSAPLPKDPRMVTLPHDCDPDDVEKLNGYRICLRREEFEVRKNQERTIMLDRPRPDDSELYDKIHFGSCAESEARYLMVPDKHEGRGVQHMQVGDISIDPLYGVFLYLSVTNQHLVYRVPLHDSSDRGSLSRWQAIGFQNQPRPMLAFDGFSGPTGVCALKNYDVLVADTNNHRVVWHSFASASAGKRPAGRLVAGLRGFMLQHPVQVAVVHATGVGAVGEKVATGAGAKGNGNSRKSSGNTQQSQELWRTLYVVERDRYVLRYYSSASRRSRDRARTLSFENGLDAIANDDAGEVLVELEEDNQSHLIPTILKPAGGLRLAVAQPLLLQEVRAAGRASAAVLGDHFSEDLHDDGDAEGLVYCKFGRLATSLTSGAFAGSGTVARRGGALGQLSSWSPPSSLVATRSKGGARAALSQMKNCLEHRYSSFVSGFILREAGRLVRWVAEEVDVAGDPESDFTTLPGGVSEQQNGQESDYARVQPETVVRNKTLEIPMDIEHFAVSPRGELYVSSGTTVYYVGGDADEAVKDFLTASIAFSRFGHWAVACSDVVRSPRLTAFGECVRISTTTNEHRTATNAQFYTSFVGLLVSLGFRRSRTGQGEIGTSLRASWELPPSW